MTESALADLQKELVDLKIYVNNLEKRVSRLQKEVKPKPKTCNTLGIFDQKQHVYICKLDN